MTNSKHVVVAGKIHDSGIDLLRAAAGVTFDFIEEMNTEAYVPFVGRADAIVIRTQPLTAAVIAAAPKLQIVSRHGVGYDAVDVGALNARAIPLTIVGDVNSRSVAEHTLMLMLAAARRAARHDAASRSGGWGVRNQFSTTELDGKTLLIVGFGRIGRRVAQLAQAFGMKVMANDPFVDENTMRAAGVIGVPELRGGLGAADYLTLHMPASPTGAVIGAAEMAAMKSSAFIINAARGGLVDEAALDAALRGGRLAGAALDVFVDEPPKPDNPLLSNERVTISPHSAGLTQECAARMAVSSVQNVLDFFNGKLDPALVVNGAALK